MEDLLTGLFDLVLNFFGDVFAEWMRRLAAVNRALYIAVFCVMLLALLGGAAVCAVNGWWAPAIGLLAVFVLALILFVLGLCKPKDRRVAAFEREQTRRFNRRG